MKRRKLKKLGRKPKVRITKSGRRHKGDLKRLNRYNARKRYRLIASLKKMSPAAIRERLRRARSQRESNIIFKQYLRKKIEVVKNNKAREFYQEALTNFKGINRKRDFTNYSSDSPTMTAAEYASTFGDDAVRNLEPLKQGSIFGYIDEDMGIVISEF